MSVTSSLERCVISTTVFATTSLTVGPAFAAGSNMPWEQPLNQILQSVEGPVAKIIAVIIIIVTGLLDKPAELAECRSVTYEQREALSECRKAWDEKRRQFLGQKAPALSDSATPQAGS